MIKYLSPGFFLFRSPVMPIKSIMKLNEALNRYEQSQNQLDFDVVKDCLADNVFQEGIYLASKEMFKLLNDWVSGVEYDKNKIQRLIKSLHKYYSRMSTRSTPYGLFAGCCLGTVTENPTILDLTNRKFRKNIRFDSNFAIRLAEFLSKDLYIKSKSKYYVNTSMYTVGDKNLYIEYALKTNQKSYSLSAVTNSIYIENVLAKAKIGSTFDELVNCVILEGVDKQDISNFIAYLSKAKIIQTPWAFSSGVIQRKNSRFRSKKASPTTFRSTLFLRLGVLNGASWLAYLDSGWASCWKKSITLTCSAKQRILLRRLISLSSSLATSLSGRLRVRTRLALTYPRTAARIVLFPRLPR